MTIRVLIADDSALMRMMISRMLEADPGIEIAGTARNGVDAVRKVRNLCPDVITMDVEMPQLDGLGALKQIMAETPTPVIMLSTLTTEGADATMEALRLGAVDFLAKPGTRANDIAEVEKDVVAKVRAAAKASVRRVNPSAITQTHSGENQRLIRKDSVSSVKPDAQVTQIVAIGSSTGGPRALDVVLKSLPVSFPCPIVIVQHMPLTFTKLLANRLNNECEIEVVEARHKQTLQNGIAYIAPGGFHVTVDRRDGQFRTLLNEDEKRNEHRPSVDVLFESMAFIRDIPRHLVILTGMGNDGAVGMQLAKQSGATTIAESEETCVVYGMPKAAIELGCVDHVAPLHRIGHKILESTSQ